MKILLKSYLQFKFHGTGVIFTMVTMFPHFPPKCGACIRKERRKKWKIGKQKGKKEGMEGRKEGRQEGREEGR